jgi:nucleotide-binding universal stress UspA family protein
MSTKLDAPVVVGVDGTAESAAATQHGVWEAQRRGRGLRLVFAHRPTAAWGPATATARDFEWEEAWVRDLLAKAKKEVVNTHPQLAIEAVAVDSTPAGALVVESHRASLVVVGTRARPGVRSHLAGSVAVQVATHAAVPVVVVRGSEPQPLEHGRPDTRPVVVGVDGSPESITAIAFAVEEAAARHAPLHAVYVCDIAHLDDIGVDKEAYGFAEATARARRLLTQVTAGWAERYPDVVIEHQVVQNVDPVRALSGAADGAGLIVVGSRGHGGFLGLRLGSTVDGLIRHASAPVAVVPGGAQD